MRKIAARTLAGLIRALEACAKIFKPAERKNHVAVRGDYLPFPETHHSQWQCPGVSHTHLPPSQSQQCCVVACGGQPVQGGGGGGDADAPATATPPGEFTAIVVTTVLSVGLITETLLEPVFAT